MLETKNPGAKAGADTVLLGGERSKLTEFDLQAQAPQDRLSLPPHLARCVLCLLRGDVW